MTPSAGLTDALTAALEVESTSQAAQLVLEGLVSVLKADAGRILFLNLATGLYEQRAAVGHTVHSDASGVPAAGHATAHVGEAADLLSVAAKSRRFSAWEAATRSAPSLLHEPPSRQRVVWPILRGSTVLALIDVEGRTPLQLGTLRGQDQLVFRIVAYVYERRFTLRLLSELQRPIQANHNRREFYKELAELISLSSGMQFIALREPDPDDDRLRCVASNGLAVPQGEQHQLDLVPISAFPTFGAALLGQTTAESSVAGEHLRAVREHPYLRNVRSFVAVPVVVGDAVLAVLSVAAQCPYDFSRMELRGFETIANASGVAMSNYKNLHAETRQVKRLAQVSAAALSDLLAQASRHEAKGYLDSAQKRLNLVERTLSGKRTDIEDPAAEIRAISAQLKQTTQAMDKMKTNALIRPGQTPVRVDLRAILLEATDQITGQIDSNDISVTVPPPGVFVQVIPEAASLAFLHLFQNSIFAFESTRAKKRGRAIDVSVAARLAGSGEVRLTFADNATGIDPGRLAIPPELEGVPWQQAIFEQGVTGSSEGTGVGLYLVRALLAQAGGGSPGSVELVEHSNRVVFAIELPAAD